MAGETEMTDLISRGASSAMPQSGATGGPAQNPAQVAELLKLISGGAGKGSPGMTGPMTTAQTSIPHATAPQTPAMNAPQIPQGTFQSRGEAQRASKQAMMNNIATIGNNITKQVNARKTREMESLVTRIQGATEGKQQAEATLKNDPNNAEAKAQLQQNQNILSDVFADPKNGKKLQKAFSVPLIGDKGKQTPEYLGLIQAIKNKDKEGQQAAGSQLADRFQKQFPSTQQLSPQYKAQADAVQKGLSPTANAQLAFQAKVTQAVTSAANNMWNRESRETVAKMLVDSRDKQSQSMLLRQVMANGGKMAVAQVIATAGIQRAKIMANAQMESTKWRMAGGYLNILAKTNADDKQYKTLKDQQLLLDKQTKDVMKRLDNMGTWEGAKDIIGQSKEISSLTKQLQDIEKAKLDVVNKTTALIGGSSGGDNSGADGTGSEEQNVNDTEFDKLFEEPATTLTDDQGTN